MKIKIWINVCIIYQGIQVAPSNINFNLFATFLAFKWATFPHFMRTIGISLIVPLDSPIKDQFQSIVMIMTIVVMIIIIIR